MLLTTPAAVTWTQREVPPFVLSLWPLACGAVHLQQAVSDSVYNVSNVQVVT